MTAAMAFLIFTLLLYFEKLHFYTDFRHFYENSPIFFSGFGVSHSRCKIMTSMANEFDDVCIDVDCPI